MPHSGAGFQSPIQPEELPTGFFCEKLELLERGSFMASEKTSIFIHFGRVLIALYFLVPGLMKFAAPARHLELMAHHNIPSQNRYYMSLRQPMLLAHCC